MIGPLAVGTPLEFRWKVLYDPEDGKPWLCRFVRKQQKRLWKAIDTDRAQSVYTSELSTTKREAVRIKQYHLLHQLRYSLICAEDPLQVVEELLNRIVALEKLLDGD